jgi:hypothetical protein
MATPAATNTYLKRINYLSLNPAISTGTPLGFTAKGDVLGFDGTTTGVLAANTGVTGQCLNLDSTKTLGWGWTTVHPINSYLHAYLTADQAIANNTWVTLNNGTQTGQGTIYPTPDKTGLYEFRCVATFDNNSAGTRYVSLVINGTRQFMIENPPVNNTNWHSMNLHAIYPVTAGQTVSFQAKQTSGFSMNLKGANAAEGNASMTFYSMRRIA